jgi:DNA repair protein RecO (recombination protein O)
MSAEKTLAIVLKTIEFSETSLIVSLFTQDFGKISALAKGARRAKGPFENALDLLAICRVLFLRKSSGSLDLLTEAKLERRFRAAQRSLAALNAGYYVAELLRELTDDHDPHPQLFQLADQTLAKLDENRGVAETVLRFELGALRELGHLPALDHCTHCGTSVEATGRVAFGLIGGGVLCLQCKPGKRQVASVSAKAIEAMQSLADGDQPAPLAPLEKSLTGEIRGLMNRYICNLLGHRPKTQNLIST